MTTPQNKPEDAGNTVNGGAPTTEPVYAPASERVPKTVSEYGDVVSGAGAATPEGQATDAEPSSFSRVPRTPYAAPGETAETSWDTSSSEWMSGGPSGGKPPMRFGLVGLGLAGGLGVWLWVRWQRERNRPINRLRRQARQTAGQARRQATLLREQMPDLPELPDEARRPAVGLGTGLLTLALVLWQQSMARARQERAAQAAREAQKKSKRGFETIADGEWVERLQHLRDRWNPARLELEKVSIPRR